MTRENFYNYRSPYVPTASTLDSMTPEEAIESGFVADERLLEVLRAVFEAGQEYQGGQSCGCC